MNVLSATLKNDGEAEFMLCVFVKHMKELQKKSPRKMQLIETLILMQKVLKSAHFFHNIYFL